MKIQIESPGDGSYAELNDRLVRFNKAHVPWQRSTFTIVARDDAGALRGGVRGVINMGVVEVRGLWLDEGLRGDGLGRTLMLDLEAEARRRGATRGTLDTYDFQARAFYEHLGYALFGTLGYPTGTDRFYLAKDL